MSDPKATFPSRDLEVHRDIVCAIPLTPPSLRVEPECQEFRVSGSCSPHLYGQICGKFIDFFQYLRACSDLTASTGHSWSMGSVGYCYDNAMAESLFVTLKKKFIGHRLRHDMPQSRDVLRN